LQAAIGIAQIHVKSGDTRFRRHVPEGRVAPPFTPHPVDPPATPRSRSSPPTSFAPRERASSWGAGRPLQLPHRPHRSRATSTPSALVVRTPRAGLVGGYPQTLPARPPMDDGPPWRNPGRRPGRPFLRRGPLEPCLSPRSGAAGPTIVACWAGHPRTTRKPSPRRLLSIHGPGSFRSKPSKAANPSTAGSHR